MPKIRSSPDPDDPWPWFEFDIDATNLEVEFTEANGLKNFPQAAQDAIPEKAVEQSVIGLTLDSAKSDEVHMLAVTLDGTAEFVPLSEQRATYYAHLAWYDPNTDEWERVEFVG